MKGLLKYSFLIALFALLVTPLFARTYSVTIPQVLTVGSIQVPAGNYKLSWEGAGPAVKVTLVHSGASPIVLNAKLVTEKSPFLDPSVVTTQKNGALVLEEIQLKSNTLIFEDSETAGK